MRTYYADHPADPVRVQDLTALPHDRQVGLAAHDDAHANLGGHAVTPRASIRLAAGAAPMSRRKCIPEKCTRPMFSYAHRRALSNPSPIATTHSTRPPAVYKRPLGSNRVPAWKQSTSVSSWSSPEISSPPRTSPGYPAAAATTPSAYCGSAATLPGSSSPCAAAAKSSSAGSASNGRNTCASGSAHLALNSSTRIPSGVSISPAYRQPTKGVPRARSASTQGCSTVLATCSANAPSRSGA